MVIKLLSEGIILGLILILICKVGIRNGAVGMVQLYHQEVQDRCVELGLTTRGEIRKRAFMVRLISMILYLGYLICCVLFINGASTFVSRFLQIFIILSIVNLIDRFFIDGYWVEKTDEWIIPGTEDLMPYIDAHDKKLKWLAGTAGMAAAAVIVAAAIGLFA